MPRIAGRVYGFLLLQREPQTLDALAESLDVSKTSVSANARLLGGMGSIRRASLPGDRRDYYEAAPSQTRMLELSLDGMRKMGQILADGTRLGVRAGDDVSHRLAVMAARSAEALQVLEKLLNRWNASDQKRA